MKLTKEQIKKLKKEKAKKVKGTKEAFNK